MSGQPADCFVNKRDAVRTINTKPAARLLLNSTMDESS